MITFQRQLLCGLLLVCFTLVSGLTVNAQLTTADLVGQVTDSTGAIVPNATVTAENKDTGAKRTVTSSDSGDFTFTLLPIGPYSVRIEAPNFKTFSAPDLILAAGDRARVDAVMQAGQISEIVEVTAAAPLLQTDSSTLGTAITGKLVQDLPLNGRNYIQLAQLVPGVSPGPANGLATGTRPDERRLNSSFSVNGQDPIANNNLIDGLDNNERVIGTIGVRPSIDAIQEFKVQTNLYSAEISRTSGGVINILTKSGTNNYHGTLFEFLRNDKLDANGNYNFTGGAQLPKQKFRQNQFGGSIGGPIIKDKTFFFGDFEDLIIRQGIPITATIPTAKQRVGDFSENCTAGFNASGTCANTAQQLNIVNIYGALPLGAVPFNRLDLAPYSTLRDPLALRIAALYPLPTAPGINTTNFASSPVRTQNAATFDVRVDHQFNQSMNLFGRYSFNDVKTLQPTGFPTVGGINPGGNFGFAGPNKTRAQNIQLNFVDVIRPNLILEVKGGYLKVSIASTTINDGKNTSTDLGFPCNSVSCINTGDIQTFGLVTLGLQGFQGLGDANFVPLIQVDDTYQGAASLTWTRGSQNIKFGANLIRRYYSLIQSNTPRGTITFNASSGNAPAPSNNGLANFIIGAPVTIARSLSPFKPRYASWEPGFFVQDDWRANKWLTLNLGVRYDIFTTKTEEQNRMANFDPATSTVLIAGKNTGKTGGISTDYGNIAPRVGFAASFAHRLVLRGGIGLSYFPGDYTSGVQLKNPPFTSSLSCGSSTTGSITNTGCPAGIGTLSQGVPVPLQPGGFPYNSDGTLNLSAIPPSSFQAVDRNFKTSFNVQYNITAEKQFGNNVLTVGYVGTRGHDLVMVLPDINRALPSGTSTANPRPFATSAPRVGSVQYYTTGGRSVYNALQISFNRRLSQGLTVTSGFTAANGKDNITGQGTGTGGYGNFIGPFSQAVSNAASYDYATSDFNVKRRFTFGGNYELPFFKSSTGVTNQVLSGWQINGSASWQTGLPFTVTDQTSVSGVIGLSGERPNLVASNIYTSTRSIGSNGQYLDPAAFALPTAFTLGNAPRNIGYGPSQRVVNGSLFKTFGIRESLKLQFRTEVFNLFNTPIFGNPNTAFGNASFGKITSTAGAYSPRQIQFALKVLF